MFDTDMGMDDLLALYVILRDPALDVRAIAIDGTGLVHCGAGIRNMRRILATFDRLDIPFGCGREEPGRDGRSFPDEWRASSDAMYGVVLPPVAASEFPPDAVTILHEALAASPEPVTVLAVGTVDQPPGPVRGAPGRPGRRHGASTPWPARSMLPATSSSGPPRPRTGSNGTSARTRRHSRP